MATITRTPKKVSLVGNPIVLGVNTTNHLSQVGQPGKLTVDITGAHAAGDYFQIVVNGDITDNVNETVRFDCSTNPDGYVGDYHPYPVYTGGDIDSIIEWVNKSAFLTKHFKIYKNPADASQIIFESKENINVDITLGTSTAAIASISTQSGQVDIRKDTFYVNIRIDLFDEDNNQWLVISEKSYSADNSGDVEANLSKVLNSYLLDFNFAFPEAHDNMLIERPDYCKKYRAFIYENDNGTLSDKIVTSNLYAMRGGLSFRQQAIYNMQDSSFWDKLLYNFNFLSYAELEQQVSNHQPTKLFFLNYSSASSLKLHVKFWQADDTTVEYDIETVSATQYKVYECIITPFKLGENITEDFVKYQVWITDESDAQISEKRTYTVDDQFREYERWFLFENSLGAAEIMRALGKRAKSNDYEQSLARVKLDFDFTDRDREESTIEKSEKQKFQAEIGFKESDQAIEDVRDFLLSKKVYEIIGKQLVPIRITSQSAPMPKDGELPFSIQFSYTRSFTDNYYSKEKTPDKYNFDYTSDYERPWNQ